MNPRPENFIDPLLLLMITLIHRAIYTLTNCPKEPYSRPKRLHKKQQELPRMCTLIPI